MAKVLRYSLLLCIAAGIVFLVSLAQMVELRYFVMVMFLAGMALFAFQAFKVTMMTTLLVISMYFVKPSPITSYAVVILLIIGLLIEKRREQTLTLYLPYPILLSTLFLFGIRGLIGAYSFETGFFWFMGIIGTPVIALICVVNSDLDESDFRLWCRIIVYIAGFVALLGVILGILNPDERLGSIWHSAMTVNGFYTLAFFLALGFSVMHKENAKGYLYGGIAIVIALGMLYTYTRMALLALAFGIILAAARIKRLRLIGIVFAGLVVLLIPSSMVSRIQLTFTHDESMFIRYIAWYHSIRLIAQNFWFGIGFDTWKHIYGTINPIRYIYAEHPHNAYLRVMLEIGVFGFVAFFLIIFRTIRDYYRKFVKQRGNDFDFFVVLAFLSILFSCLTDLFFLHLSVSLLFWILMAFMYRRIHVDDTPPEG